MSRQQQGKDRADNVQPCPALYNPLAQQLFTDNEVAQQLQVHVRTFHRMVNVGQFPPPLRRGRKWCRWTQKDIDDFLGQLEAARAR